MTLEELIRRFRNQANDRQEPYLFATEDVTDWLNDAQRQACIRGRLIREDELPPVCSIALAPGKHTYALHPSVYEIICLRLLPGSGGAPRPLASVSREALDAECPDWRESTYPACQVIQDDTTLRVVGSVSAGDSISLECYRLPLKSLDDDSDKPEIHVAHHEHLIYWALHKAFSIPDADGFDPQRAATAEAAFTRYFGLLPDADMRRSTRVDVVQHNKAVFI